VTGTELIGISAAGALGAPARYAIDTVISRRRRDALPVGIFVINVTGSLVLGLIAGAALYHGFGGAPRAWLGTGFCGAYTTFSTFGLQTVGLVELREQRAAGTYVVASTVVGLAAAATGLWVAGVL